MLNDECGMVRGGDRARVRRVGNVECSKCLPALRQAGAEQSRSAQGEQASGPPFVVGLSNHEWQHTYYVVIGSVSVQWTFIWGGGIEPVD